MIIQSLIEGCFRFVDFVLAQIPELPLFDSLSYLLTAVSSVWGYLNSFIIVSDVVAVIGVVLFVDNIGFALRIFKYVKNMLPFN